MALFAELLERRVNLVSIRDSIDLNTPAGRLIVDLGRHMTAMFKKQ